MQDSKKERLKAKSSTFPVSYSLEEIKENITINTNTNTNTNTDFKPSKEQIINQAFKFHSQGKITEAVKYYQLFINQGFKDYRVFSNYGIILRRLGNLKDAEVLQRKAIDLKPNLAELHTNLGIILKDLGRLKEAEISTRKAIGIDPDSIEAHRNLEYLKIKCKEFHNLHCTFCGQERKCKIIKANSRQNKYTNQILLSNSSNTKKIKPYELFSRLCFRCLHCGSQFYNPNLSDDLFDKVYKAKPVFHHAGWWSFYNNHLNKNELFLKEKKKINEILNLSDNYIRNRIGIYCEVNCPFQGIVKTFNFNSKEIDLQNKFLSEKFRTAERILAIEESKEIWSDECQLTLSPKDQEIIKEENKIITCRDTSISSKLFHTILNFNSELFMNKIEENKKSSNIILFSNTLDHLPNPLRSLSKSIELFDLVLITLHPYNPNEGPTMQHKMQIGNLYSNWKNLIKTPCEIYDLSKLLSKKLNISPEKCDRLILIKKN